MARALEMSYHACNWPPTETLADMTLTPELAGAIMLDVPLIILALVILRRQPRAIQLFALALLVVGVGYLMAVGATADIARMVLPSQFPAAASVKA